MGMLLKRLRLLVLSTLFMGSNLCGLLAPPLAWARNKAAPKPLFRDPIHDGAADPSLIWNRATRKWMMFYTNRRADLHAADPKDVAWVHGTRIGIAESRDGAHWRYAGVAEIPYGKEDYTFWAPDVIRASGFYHMFVTVVPGVFHDWNASREIIHLTSADLTHWRFVQKIPLPSVRAIDPYVFKLENGTWRLWYKDESDHSHLHSIDSDDLLHWANDRVAISDRSCEGPIVFRWKGSIWLIVDCWKGLGVYRSSDALHWIPQQDNLLASPGLAPTDRSEGHHADVVVQDSRAYLYYFVRQTGPDSRPDMPESSHRSVIQVVELSEDHGIVTADRNVSVHVALLPRTAN
jgi:hypothetical protein